MSHMITYLTDEEYRELRGILSKAFKLRNPPQREYKVLYTDSRGTLYFLQDDTNGLIKIGRSRNVLSRIKAIQHVYGNPMTLLGVMPNKAHLESRVHARFSYLQAIREDDLSAREWFAPGSSLMAYIDKYAAPIGAFEEAKEFIASLCDALDKDGLCTVKMRDFKANPYLPYIDSRGSYIAENDRT